MTLLSIPLLLGAVIIATLVSYIRRLVSKDAAVPGPRLNLLSSLPLKYHESRGQRTAYVYRLHLQHGSVVRLAPNEVAFASLPALKEIYMSQGSGNDKMEFYHLFRQYRTPTMFSTLDKQTHRRRRRSLADRYANSNVVKEEALHGIRERAQRFAALVTSAPGNVLDTGWRSCDGLNDGQQQRRGLSPSFCLLCTAFRVPKNDTSWCLCLR